MKKGKGINNEIIGCERVRRIRRIRRIRRNDRIT